MLDFCLDLIRNNVIHWLLNGDIQGFEQMIPIFFLTLLFSLEQYESCRYLFSYLHVYAVGYNDILYVVVLSFYEQPRPNNPSQEIIQFGDENILFDSLFQDFRGKWQFGIKFFEGLRLTKKWLIISM